MNTSAAPESLRSLASLLAARLDLATLTSDAKTLRGATKCWTVYRACMAAHQSLPHAYGKVDDASLDAIARDLLALALKAATIGHKIAGEALLAA